jgi:hypothetical protein
VKMDGFARKRRMVAGGHTTEAPKTPTSWTSVVSRERIRIILTMAALNDLKVNAADIMSACLTAPVSEKTWTRLGPDFGSYVGKKAAIPQAL